MSWEHYAKHKCGYTTGVPFGNSNFLTNFNTLCDKCGERWKIGDFEQFIGRKAYKGKWNLPLSWFKVIIERKPENE